MMSLYRRLITLALVFSAGILSLGACAQVSSSSASGVSGSGEPGVPAALAAGPIITFDPALGTTDRLRPDQKITVSVADGTLVSVKASTLGDQPRELAGNLAAGTWASKGPLQVNSTYQVVVTVQRRDGSVMARTARYATIRVDGTSNLTLIPSNGSIVGVGMPIIAQFSRPVINKAAAVAALKVTTTPQVTGSWRWLSPTLAHYRPQTYWPAGTQVSVAATLQSVELAPGIWGKSNVSSAFTIGRAVVATVDMQQHTLTIKRDGEVVKTIPVTNGKPGFATRIGTKVIMSRESLVRMDAATTGIDPKDPEYYRLDVHWALRLTYSGEFLHAAPWSAASHGRANVSHGCTGMSMANAQWVYDNLMIGDVVEFTGGTRTLEPGNGYTDWNIPYDQWANT